AVCRDGHAANIVATQLDGVVDSPRPDIHNAQVLGPGVAHSQPRPIWRYVHIPGLRPDLDPARDTVRTQVDVGDLIVTGDRNVRMCAVWRYDDSTWLLAHLNCRNDLHGGRTDRKDRSGV